MMRKGDWWVRSEKDPRWNKIKEDVLVGGFCMTPDMKEYLEEMKKKYGDPPDDLTFEYMKY